MSKLRFSGHESFQCRNLWLKKGFDFINGNEAPDFNNQHAVIDLGVGKNMTSSIRFWLDAFGILDNKNKGETSELANKLLSDNGWDPYLEDIGSLWLLHYLLISRSKASIYSLIFNYFRKHRFEFTKEHIKTFLINTCNERGESHSPNTIDTDIGVFLKTYLLPTSKDRNYLEDQFSSLLIELNLVKEFETIVGEKKELWYKIESSERETLPIQIFFFSILDQIEKKAFGYSISFNKLLNGQHTPGSVFALHPDSLVTKIERLTQKYKGVSYKEDGGVRELQVNQEFSKFHILEDYYGRN